ncbi:MAG: HAD-IA family hydrolase [Rhodobacteraceae bacterium]|nr:HAD-IA family hydrolase [Paracoccaceae bacterium]
MSKPLRLIIFDVDGTLVDSQTSILTAMQGAFGQINLPAPSREEVLSIVGLSLDNAMARLAPDLSEATRQTLVAAYKDTYHARSLQTGSAKLSPLYPGAREMLDKLAAIPEYLLGVATGKSQRGLDALIADHGLERMFITRQVADHHPSKPHPSMIETAMSEAGVDRTNTVMIGDTSFDMDMAQAAGVTGIGVSWGYHPVAALGSAAQVIDTFAELPQVLNFIWKEDA